MLDVRARRRRDRRQRLSQPRNLPIHYATLGALAGAILAFVLYLTVPVAMGVERFITMTPLWENVLFVAIVILSGTAGLLAAAYIWKVRHPE